MFSRAAPVTSQAANQGETPECPSCLGKVPALPATMEFWGLSDAEGCLAGAGWGVALSGLQCILTLEFWLCYHVSLGPCCEGVLGKRESLGYRSTGMLPDVQDRAPVPQLDDQCHLSPWLLPMLLVILTQALHFPVSVPSSLPGCPLCPLHSLRPAQPSNTPSSGSFPLSRT